MKKILILGASGMVGSQVLDAAIKDTSVSEIVSLVRKKRANQLAKVKEVVVTDFTDYASVKEDLRGVDVCYFCIGVYTGAVPEPEFRKITVEYVVTLADELFEQSPQATFCLLSGAGADQSERSRMMFARYKGMAENYLLRKGFSNVFLFRPGYIYPEVKREEPNFSYRLMRKLYKPLIKPFFPSMAIPSGVLARVIYSVGINEQGKRVLENKEMLQIAKETFLRISRYR